HASCARALPADRRPGEAGRKSGAEKGRQGTGPVPQPGLPRTAARQVTSYSAADGREKAQIKERNRVRGSPRGMAQGAHGEGADSRNAAEGTGRSRVLRQAFPARFGEAHARLGGAG